ncbi:MAG TPA: DeoR/GlpR family DNA-binding transcription regulator [Jatrophihabitans sp.]
MSKYERLNRLLELLAADGHVSVEDAATRLDVSPATVRRDLDSLANQQLLTRTHGGAVSNSTAYDLPLRYKTARNAEEKVRIAHAAAGLVPFGSVVGLNGGTTTTEVARALATRADLHADSGQASVTVVTNALNIANELTVRSQVKIVVLGGVPRAQSYELVGPLAVPVLNQLTLDIAVLGVDAFDLSRGASAHNEAEAEINARIANQARRVLVVADSSKLGKTAFAQIVPASKVHTLITDSDADPALVKEISGAGIEVVQT